MLTSKSFENLNLKLYFQQLFPGVVYLKSKGGLVITEVKAGGNGLLIGWVTAKERMQFQQNNFCYFEGKTWTKSLMERFLLKSTSCKHLN